MGDRGIMETPNSYRLESNPDMVLKLGGMTLDEVNEAQHNLLDQAQRLLADIKILGNVAMEKWGEL